MKMPDTLRKFDASMKSFARDNDPRREPMERMFVCATYWLDKNPGADLENSPELDAYLERIAPGFSGGMFATVLWHLDKYRELESWEGYCNWSQRQKALQ
jgi:hypothetical protein